MTLMLFHSSVIFNHSPDPFIQARATAISSGVSGTIFRTANRRPEGLQAVFDLPNGMMDITTTVYVSSERFPQSAPLIRRY